MNDLLFLDERDKEIARLNILVERFKEYDKKRNAYVRNLEANYKELCENSDIKKSTERISELERGMRTLSNKLLAAQIPEYIDNLSPEELKDTARFVQMKRQIRELTRENKRLKSTIGELAARLNGVG